MAPAYSWFLAVRYLLARWVNVMGIAGVAIAVWALIVVVSVFSGFIADIRDHIRGASSDLVLTVKQPDASYASLRKVLERDPDVVATAPRLEYYAMLFPYGAWQSQPNYMHPMGAAFTNSVVLVGVDPEREARTTAFGKWLGDVPASGFEREGDPPFFRVPDLERPFAISAHRQREAMVMAGLDVPEGKVLSTAPGLVVGYDRTQKPGERLVPGQLVDLVTARFERSGGEEKVVKVRRPCVVAGAFETHHSQFDMYRALVHIDTLREMLGEDQELPGVIDIVSEVAIKVRPGADPLAVRARLAAQSDLLGGGAIETWEEQNAIFLGAVDHERAMMKVVLFIVMLVAAFLIYAMLHMMVMQKIKDIGILSSLGAAPSGIAAVFVLCGVVVGVLGCAVGTTLGVLSAVHLNDVNEWCRTHFELELFPTRIYDLERIPYRLELGWVAQVILAALALSVLVAWLPARRAARMDPVRALSYE